MNLDKSQVIGRSKRSEAKRACDFTLALFTTHKARTKTMRERQKRVSYPIRRTENVCLQQLERLVFLLKTGKYAKMDILVSGQQSREKETSFLEALTKISYGS